MEASFIFQFIILIISVIIHEVAHGYMALWLGDPTAKYEGRLTLNPVKHIDLWGSIIIPIITTLAGFTFGWAKPVPYNPYNLRNQRWGDALVAIAGPASNIILASLFGLVIRLGMHFSFLSAEFISLASLVVLVNIVLALFNLVPIPPLDGSKIFFSIWGPLR
ncbi:MAG TPA: site-2 protease family protein, partial [Candidatus Paceibacterota bacterium]